MKKGVVIGVIVGIVILGVFLFLFLNHDFESSDIDRSENNRLVSENEELIIAEDNKKDCDLEFTEYLIDPLYVQKVGQVGVVHGFGKSIVERSYISVKEEHYEKQILIYSPTDMTLISGAHYKVSNDQNYMADYVLKFDAGCNVEVLLGHLKGVVDSIDNQMMGLKNDSREDMLKPIKFEAGDLIGYYYQQSSGGVAGFDFIVRDRKIINQFINQERYTNRRADNLISGVCPYDYYNGEKKEVYYNLLGGGGGTLFKVKNCGNSSRDVAGTISGMWFLDKEIVGSIYDYYMDGDYGSPVSIVGDEERISIGNLGRQEPVIYIYSTNPTYKLPEEITKEHCYQKYQNFENSDSSGYVYFKVVDNSTIDVSFSSSGTCPGNFPSSGSKLYYK